MRNFTLASVIVLGIVVLVVGVASVLLAMTVDTAQEINDKAQTIAENGTGINRDTDSVVQLRRTTALAESILRTADPLEGKLTGIVDSAKSINGLAGSINESATAINGTAGNVNESANAIDQAAGAINSSAGSINSSAGTINGHATNINALAGRVSASAGTINQSANIIDNVAASILRVGRRVDTDVRLINQNLDVTLSLVTAVKGDTGNILLQAKGALDTGGCIDREVHLAASWPDCGGAATPASIARARRAGPGSGKLPASLEKLLKDQKDTLGKIQDKSKQLQSAPTPAAPAPLGGKNNVGKTLLDRLLGSLKGNSGAPNSAAPQTGIKNGVQTLLDRLLGTLKGSNNAGGG